MPTTTQRAAVPAPGRSRLGWTQSLQFKLGALFIALTLVLGAGTLLAGKLLVNDELVAETFRYELESGQRLSLQFSEVARRVELLAAVMAQLAADPHLPVPDLIAHDANSALVVAAGIWPEPRTLDPARDRASRYWVRDAGGALVAHDDYNDPRTVPYYHEKWYMPAHHAQPNRCYWTPAYHEPLSKRDMVSCAMPILGAGGTFEGVVTVSLGLADFNQQFEAATRKDLGYSLLVDFEDRLLAMSALANEKLGAAGPRPRNLPELARNLPAFNPVAVAMRQQDEQFVQAAKGAPSYREPDIDVLKQDTRDLSRDEAAEALSQLWAAQAGFQAAPTRQQIAHDAILDEPAFASSVPLPGTPWRLLRITPATEGFAGASYIFLRTLMVIGGGVLLALLVVFIALRLMVIGPLRDMTARLASAESTDDAMKVSLDESPANEIGLLAYWLNQRVRQLRELMQRTVTTNAQLVSASDERRKTQEALARVTERSALALQSVSDGVIATDESGLVEDMNPVAESLTGFPLRQARSKDFADIFIARLGETGTPLPNLAQVAVQRGSKLEYLEGVTLFGAGGMHRDVRLTVTPIRTRHNRVTGAVVVFRERDRGGGAEAQALAHDRSLRDPLTGLPMRLLCDSRIRALIEASRLEPRVHALLLVDIDRLREINDIGGPAAGDQVLTRVAEVLVSSAGKAGEVFRLRGGQFAVVLENLDSARARVFAETLREFVAGAHYAWDGKDFAVSASIGVTEFDERDDDPVPVIARAGEAAAAAKRAGRNQVMLHDAGMSNARADDAAWVKRIRSGLEQNLFHFTTQALQPSAALAGEGQPYEVLLALEDEEGFWTAPANFLPPAQRHQLDGEIDRWVLSRVISHLAHDEAAVERLGYVGINLAPSTISDSHFLEFLAQQLQQLPNLPPRKLCFELRESDVIDHAREAQIFCAAMRSIGCRVAIDHFSGRNSSTLALIRGLGAQLAKIDGLAYAAIASDPLQQQLAESVIKLARALHLRVAVCNLENGPQLEAWRRLGADYYQGHAIAKPSPLVFSPLR
ncbi:MAG TPA: EAL domain-containing protein [Nevskiaceae bacterium]|nr:EAL domain-containing protein [Nevskiaceae bacterium]